MGFLVILYMIYLHGLVGLFYNYKRDRDISFYVFMACLNVINWAALIKIFWVLIIKINI